jgi:acyl carrier protein
MVPAAFVILPALPLSPSGKVDRRALALLVPGREEVASRTTESATPRDAVEETLAGIWSGVLETGAIGVHDDFFALGGHSLRATRVMSRVRKAFGVDVPLSALFAAPTVAGLAEIVRGQMAKDGGAARAARPVLRPVPRTALCRSRSHSSASGSSTSSRRAIRSTTSPVPGGWTVTSTREP